MTARSKPTSRVPFDPGTLLDLIACFHHPNPANPQRAYPTWPSTQASAMQPSGALARRLRARFCSRRARIALAQGAQRRNHRRKADGIRRMSVNENVPQQRWAAQRQAGSDGDTRLARGYIIYDGWCNRARRGADSTGVVTPTRGSGPRQDAAGALLLSVHDRSWLSSCRAKSARSVSRSEARTTERRLNLKI
jgi:hypothetical protein